MKTINVRDDLPSKHSTINDVSMAVGVSVSTVSRVMNGNFHGAPEIAQKVHKVIDELGYQPNPLARSLAVGRTNAIGFVVPDISISSYQLILTALSKEAAHNGFNVLVADTGEDPALECLKAQELRRRCDCVALCSPRMGDEDLAELSTDLAPLVLINRTTERQYAPSVVTNYEAGMCTVAQHLYDLGHRKIAYVPTFHASAAEQARKRGLKKFFETHDDATIQTVECGYSAEEAEAQSDRILPTGATAVICAGDRIAIGILSGLRNLGLTVPADISVTGFGNIRLSQFMTPALTTVADPIEALGREAWRRLFSQIQHHEPEPNISFEPKLIIRQSAGPVKSV